MMKLIDEVLEKFMRVQCPWSWLWILKLVFVNMSGTNFDK